VTQPADSATTWPHKSAATKCSGVRAMPIALSYGPRVQFQSVGCGCLMLTVSLHPVSTADVLPLLTHSLGLSTPGAGDKGECLDSASGCKGLLRLALCTDSFNGRYRLWQLFTVAARHSRNARVQAAFILVRSDITQCHSVPEACSTITRHAPRL
jgi:hypothetical protein